MLVELSVMEQRYEVVMAVLRDGLQVSEVAQLYGVSRQSVHAWIARYQHGGIGPSRTGRTGHARAPTRWIPQRRPGAWS